MNPLDYFNSRRLPVGIDINGSTIRMLQLQRRFDGGRGFEASFAACIDLPPAPAGEPGGSDARIQAICEAIRSRLATREVRGRDCVITLDDRLLRIRSVRHPRMPDDELDRAVALDAAARLGFSESEPLEVGWIRAGEVRQGEEYREEIIMVGAARDPIERLVFGLAGIGLRPQAVEPPFVSVARAYSRTLRRNEDQEKVRVIADIGALATGVTITRGQRIVFHKPIEIGGQAMTQAAATRLGLDIDAIADLRRQRMAGIGVEARVERAMFEAIRPAIMDLSNEISLCLRYFGVSFRGSRAESCIVTGRDAAEPQLTELIEQSLHLPTHLGHPLDGVTLDRVSTLINERHDAEWAGAAGLGMRFLRQAPSSVPGNRRRADVSAGPAAPRREAA